MRAIIADHAFVDGNKRTGMLAGLALIKANGVIFRASEGEIEDFAVSIATEHLDVPTISTWIHAHVG